MRTSRRWASVALASMIVAAACSSDPATDTPSEATSDPATGSTPPAGTGTASGEPFFLESADGVFSVELPAGPYPGGVDPSLTTVEPALAGTTAVSGAYELAPTDLRLPEPVIATFRTVSSALPPDGLPLLVAVFDTDTGVVPAFEGRTSRDEAGDVVHLANFDRFGVVALIDGGVTFSLDPVQIGDLGVGDTFEVTAVAQARPSVVEPWAVDEIQARWNISGALTATADGEVEPVRGFGSDGSADEWVLSNEITCDAVGSGGYVIEFSVRFGGGETPSRQFVTLEGEANCGDVGR